VALGVHWLSLHTSRAKPLIMCVDGGWSDWVAATCAQSMTCQHANKCLQIKECFAGDTYIRALPVSEFDALQLPPPLPGFSGAVTTVVSGGGKTTKRPLSAGMVGRIAVTPPLLPAWAVYHSFTMSWLPNTCLHAYLLPPICKNILDNSLGMMRHTHNC
jgi:hypothetical protein